VSIALSWPAWRTTRFWVFGLSIGVTFGIDRGLAIGLSPPELGLGGARNGVEAAAISIPAAILVFTLLGYQTLGRIEQHKRRYANRPGIEGYEIQPLESLDWRWFDRDSFWRGGWWGLAIGPLIGLALWPHFGPWRAVSFGFIATLFVAVFSGLSGTALKVSVDPNQGIVRSLRHAARMTALFSLTGALAFGVSYGEAHGALEGAVNALLALVLAFSFLVFGGIPVIRHICLGHVLHRAGVLPSWWAWPPWRPTLELLRELVRFKFLRRSAGGFTFRHGILRSYYEQGGTRR